jgi:hypothetical protein
MYRQLFLPFLPVLRITEAAFDEQAIKHSKVYKDRE